MATRDTPCRHGRDGSNRPRRAGYPPLPASRDARGNASKGLPTMRGTASAPASSRGSTTGYRWRSGSATATGTTIASSPQSVPFPSQTSAPYPPRKREEPARNKTLSIYDSRNSLTGQSIYNSRLPSKDYNHSQAEVPIIDIIYLR